MIFPAAWHESEIISAGTFHVLWALGGGVICATAIYGFFVEIRVKVSAFIYLGITTTRFDELPVWYVFYLLMGLVVVAVSGAFAYANISAMISNK